MEDLFDQLINGEITQVAHPADQAPTKVDTEEDTKKDQNPSGTNDNPEEDGQTKKDPDPDDSSDNNDNNSDDEEDITPEKLVYDTFENLELLPEGVEFNPEDPEQLDKIARDLPITMLKKGIERLHPDAQGLFTFAMKNGSNRNTMLQYFESFIKPRILEHDIETDNGARQFVTQYLRSTGNYIDEDHIQDTITRLVDSNRLQGYAADIYKRVNEHHVAREAEYLKKDQERQDTANRTRARAVELTKQSEWSDERIKRGSDILERGELASLTTSITKNPSHVAEFVHLLTYYTKEEGFKGLFDVLQSRADTKKNDQKERLIGSKLSRVKTKRVPQKERNEEKTDEITIPEEEANKLFNEFLSS